ncbi:MAG TPA: YopT-type cysteine protease domain-containing protein [Pseudomonadota bacterium]|nr:YopT-type cysteine protease domain-containing protein [Pseudomonadota bacterium]
MAVVHAYKQTDDKRTKDGDLIEVTSGWCIGMVVHWILAKKEGADFWKKAAGADGEQAFRMIMAMQQIWYKQGGWNQKKEYDIFDKLLGGKKVKRVHYNDTTPKKVISPEDVWMGITNTAGRFGLINIGFAQGGHAMGVCKNSDESFNFFDPNCGEFKWKDVAEFRKGLKAEIFDKMNYRNAVNRLIIAKYD